MDDAEIAIRQHLSKPRPWNDACACMGPLNGQPLCPCKMAWVETVNGRYWLVKEHRSPEGIKHTASLL
jgi:hypothetical protein